MTRGNKEGKKPSKNMKYSLFQEEAAATITIYNINDKGDEERYVPEATNEKERH